MKTKVGLLIGICIIIALIACEKELDIQKNASAYTYSNVDEKAGQWKPVFLTNVTDITVSTPAPNRAVVLQFQRDADTLSRAAPLQPLALLQTRA